MKPIEGITPDMLWTALIVIIGAGTLYVLYGKVRETYEKIKERKRLQNDPGDRLAEDISQKVLDNLEPRFSDIDRKLANDKTMLDTHSRQIETLNKRMDRTEGNLEALLEGMSALMDHAMRTDETPKLAEAKEKLDSHIRHAAAKN